MPSSLAARVRRIQAEETDRHPVERVVRTGRTVVDALDGDAHRTRMRYAEAMARVALVAPLSVWAATRPESPGWARALSLVIGATSFIGGAADLEDLKRASDC